MNIRLVFLFILIGIFYACNDEFTDPNDTLIENENEDKQEIIESANADITLKIDATDAITINPLIFGINNDWRIISDETFADFANTIQSIDYSILRFPGGWESEFYAWSSNSTPGWNRTPEKAGASVTTMKNHVSAYTIVLPTNSAMNAAVGSNQWNTAINNLKTTIDKAFEVTDMSNGIVEIGNEWWLQFAGGSSRAEKLDKYVNVVMEIAAYINTRFPNRTFKVLINGDYTKPDEFASMKSKFSRVYDVIDGVALHTYTGYTTDTHNIEDLEQRILDCANNFNPQKNFVYLSEWMPSRDYNERALYMEAANIIPDIIQIYARAGADAAAYWPPINTPVPGLGITNWNYSVVYPIGQILGEMSKSYKGEALKTISNKFHLAAAKTDESTIVMYITGGKESGKKVAVKIEGFRINSIDEVERYIPSDYSETSKPEPYVIQAASAKLTSDNEVVVDVNVEGLYQIYKIVVKGS